LPFFATLSYECDNRIEKPPHLKNFFLTRHRRGMALEKSATMQHILRDSSYLKEGCQMIPLSLPLQEVTQLLVDWGNGNQAALDRLIPLVYTELRQLAHRYMRRERLGHTMQTTALVHEAYLRLINQNQVRWQNQAHFFGIAARLMRQILIEHARSHTCAKRGGSTGTISLDEVATVSQARATELIALDDALERLAATDPRKGQVVELRFFGGLSVEEAAQVLNVAPNTVLRDWRMAKAWLHREISYAH
jgi:RNA polymerase sigma-70 factor, ECF subfamily